VEENSHDRGPGKMGATQEGQSLDVLLGNGVVLKYILRSRDKPAVGFLDEGTVERDGLRGLTVRDKNGAVIDELSGNQIRSWNVVGPDGTSIDNDIVANDYGRLF
jgi:hypothetical protein